MKELDEFTRAYIEAALWSSNDESDDEGGEPFSDNYTEYDIAPEAIEQIVEDCKAFQAKHVKEIAYENYFYRTDCSVELAAGHDFWLTRNGHGAGFWDSNWEESAGKAMDDTSKEAGECHLSLGDDGKIYLE